jgi:cellulose biosynthesis protein BcsQ
MIRSSVAVANNKGGVGKTTIAANVGGLVAAAGHRVLIVDLDPQANIGTELGISQAGASDGGTALSKAVQFGEAVEPLRAVRPNLDVVCGGPQLIGMEDALRHQRPTPVGRLEEALAPIAPEYDLILYDCPPRFGSLLVEMAFAAAHWVLIPTKVDGGSIEGLDAVATQFAATKADVNPAIELLGIVLFDVRTTDSTIRAEAKAEVLELLGGHERVFLDQFIRSSPRAQRDTRKTGLLVHEYDEDAVAAKQAGFRRLRKGGDAPAVPRFATNTSGLAKDFQDLTTELCERMWGRS